MPGRRPDKSASAGRISARGSPASDAWRGSRGPASRPRPAVRSTPAPTAARARVPALPWPPTPWHGNARFCHWRGPARSSSGSIAFASRSTLFRLRQSAHGHRGAGKRRARRQLSSAASVWENMGNNVVGGTGSSIVRMWLSVGIFCMANSVWQLEVPRPRASAVCWARNDGLCIKNTENAAMPMSVM
jgi:hypothetical protein